MKKLLSFFTGALILSGISNINAIKDFSRFIPYTRDPNTNELLVVLGKQEPSGAQFGAFLAANADRKQINNFLQGQRYELQESEVKKVHITGPYGDAVMTIAFTEIPYRENLITSTPNYQIARFPLRSLISYMNQTGPALPGMDNTDNSIKDHLEHFEGTIKKQDGPQTTILEETDRRVEQRQAQPVPQMIPAKVVQPTGLQSAPTVAAVEPRRVISQPQPIAQSPTQDAQPLTAPSSIDASSKTTQALPTGSYQESCTKCKLDGNRLTCECRTQTGDNQITTLDMSTHNSANTIANCNGTLKTLVPGQTCSSPALPTGSYKNSCREFSMDGSVLKGKCLNTRGVLVDTAIDVATISADHEVSNCDGILKAGPKGRGCQ